MKQISQSNPIDQDILVTRLPIASVRPAPDNARTHSKQSISALARSITSFGVFIPILIRSDGQIIAGAGRLEAAQLLGWKTVPTICADHLTDAQARAYSLADNKTHDMSRFDPGKLAANFKILSGLDLTFELTDIGFSMGEIDLTIEAADAGVLPDDDLDRDPLPAGPAVTQPNMLWRLGQHRLFCGDALKEGSYAQLLKGELVKAGFFDPPYNVPIIGHVRARKSAHREFAVGVGELKPAEFVAFLSQAMSLATRHSAKGAVHFYCMDWKHLADLLKAGEGVFDALINICVWVKNNGGMGSLYRSTHEMVVVYRYGAKTHRNNVQLGKYGRNRTNVWSYPGANSFLRTSEEADLLAQHPTPKPVALVADALLDVTARGDLVMDSFMGSGGTLLACERVGRICRGLEIDPLYCDLAIRRWQRVTGADAILEATGETFNAIAAKVEAPQ